MAVVGRSAPTHVEELIKEKAPTLGKEARLEDAADRFIKLANRLKLSREEMTTVCGTLYSNHAVVTGVSRERAHKLVDVFWDWRGAEPPSPKVLVKERK